MRSIDKYIIEPKDGRYNNTTKIGDVDFVVNTDMFNHKYISREARVISTPSIYDLPIKKGMDIIVHHNIFRRWHDVRGNERDSSSFIREDRYYASLDQVFLYKEEGKWKAFGDTCYVSPVKNTDIFELGDTVKNVGILEISNQQLEAMELKVGDIVRFPSKFEYEFVIDGQLMYRLRTKNIYAKEEAGSYEKYTPENYEM